MFPVSIYSMDIELPLRAVGLEPGIKYMYRELRTTAEQLTRGDDKEVISNHAFVSISKAVHKAVYLFLPIMPPITMINLSRTRPSAALHLPNFIGFFSVTYRSESISKQVGSKL